jgi:uncharacterized membrane protein
MFNRLKDQLKDPVVKGHPLHAMLSDVPIGTLVAGCAFDLIGMLARKPAWRVAARAAHTCAFASGCAAALVGLWDYQAVPPEHPARRVGALHGYLNASVLSLLVPSLLLRREADAPINGRPATSAVVFGAAALSVLGISGWLGGDLVYHLGWRVTPAEHAEQLEEALRQRGESSLIEIAHDTVHQYEMEHTLIP